MQQVQIPIMFPVVPFDSLFVVRGWGGFELHDYVHGVAVGFVLQLACELAIVRCGHTRQRKYDHDERGFRFHRCGVFPKDQSAGVPPKCLQGELIERNAERRPDRVALSRQVGRRDNLAWAMAHYFGVTVWCPTVS
jgi:hypothetical protein